MTRLADQPSVEPGRTEHDALAIAIDGGTSKTEVLLVRRDGTVLARGRGGGFRPQSDGIDAAMEVLAAIIASLPYGKDEPVELVPSFLAGADLPEEEVVLAERLAATGWARRVTVG